MSREEFFEWLNTCPSHKWEVTADEWGYLHVVFKIVEEKEDE
jgi:hypothetical protein